jgi:plasmid stability protein
MSVMSSRPVPSMKRTTVMLPDDLRRRAFVRARERGVSLGELIRESLDAAVPASSPARAVDSLFTDSAVFAGKAPKDLSAAHDGYLYGEGA